MNSNRQFIFLLFFFLIPLQSFPDPVNFEWSIPEIISEENDEFLKTDLSIFSDDSTLSIIWVKGKVGDSGLFQFYRDGNLEFNQRLTKAHEDRDPRIFEFKGKYYIIFSRRIIEQEDERKTYQTPSILMLIHSSDLKNWSEPEILKVNLKGLDNLEPYPHVQGRQVEIFWVAGTKTFFMYKTQSSDLKKFSVPKKVFEQSGNIHYPYLAKTGESKNLLVFQVNHSLYFSTGSGFSDWSEPKILFRHSNRQYRPSGMIREDGRLILTFNSSAYLWVTENIQPGNYDDWFSPVKISFKNEKDNPELEYSLTQDIHPVISMRDRNSIYLAWAGKRRGVWKIFLSTTRIN